MKKVRILVLAVAMISVLMLGGCAALGLGGGGSQATGPLAEQQTLLVMAFDESLADILLAKSILLEALGFKEAADKLKADADNMKKGNTSEGDKKAATERSAEADAYIKEASSKGEKLDKAKAEKAKQALAPFGRGNLKAATMLTISAAFLTDSATEIANNPMNALSLKSSLSVGTFVAQALPGYVKSNAEVFGVAIELLKKSGVDTKDAEKSVQATKNAGPQE